MDRTDILRATVNLPEKRGRGVLVPGNLILTAAHCLNYSTEGEMVLGDHYLERVSAQGLEFRLSAWFLDPVSDLAVLGEPDSQTFPTDADAFWRFCESTRPVSIFTDTVTRFEKIRSWILNLNLEWVRAEMAQHGESGHIWGMTATKKIQGGASGGPIVDKSGRLLGIVSVASDGDMSEGSAPNPNLALPIWILKIIEDHHEPRPKE
jgi:hypothetical protein